MKVLHQRHRCRSERDAWGALSLPLTKVETPLLRHVNRSPEEKPSPRVRAPVERETPLVLSQIRPGRSVRLLFGDDSDPVENHMRSVVVSEHLKETLPVTDILFSFRLSFGHLYTSLFLFADALPPHGRSKLSTSGFLVDRSMRGRSSSRFSVAAFSATYFFAENAL